MDEIDLDQMADDIVEQQKPQPKSNLDINTLKSVGIIDRSFTDYDKLLTPTPIDERESLLNPTIYQHPMILSPERMFPYNDINEREISSAVSSEKTKKHQKIYNKLRAVIPEVKAKHQEYLREYHQRPEVKERLKNYYQQPGVKAAQGEYIKKRANEVVLSKQEKFDKSMDEFYPGWRDIEFTPEKLKELKETKKELSSKINRQMRYNNPGTKEKMHAYAREYYHRKHPSLINIPRALQIEETQIDFGQMNNSDLTTLSQDAPNESLFSKAYMNVFNIPDEKTGFMGTHKNQYERTTYPKIQEKRKEYAKKYNQRPDVVQRQNERYNKQLQNPEFKQKRIEYINEYRQRPEVIQHSREYSKEYIQNPEVQERTKQYRKEYWARPEVKQRITEYRQTPEAKQKSQIYMKEYTQRPGVKEMRQMAQKRYEVKKKMSLIDEMQQGMDAMK